MILSVAHISKSFLDQCVLRDATFHLEDREKCALIGVNGAGKTTLLRIIIGDLPADGGEVTVAKGKTVGYLAQHQDLPAGRTIREVLLETKREVLDLEERIRSLEQQMKGALGDDLEALLSAYAEATHAFEQADGYAVRSEVTGVLKGLGFPEEEFDKDVASLSGGQKTRVTLAKLLLTRPDVLLLDEPTNHLDLESVAWLENFLGTYPGAVLVSSHDRYFLDRIVTKCVEIERGEVISFPGNYTAFSAKKQEMIAARQKAYLNQQREIRHQEEVIAKLRSFNREKSIKRAESREKQLAKIDRIEKPITSDDTMHFELNPGVESGKDVMSIRGLAKSFGAQELFSDVSLDIRRGEHIAIVGRNGTGKTTLLKIINGITPADAGVITLGARVHIAYYDQEQHVLHSDKTVFDEMADANPRMTETQVRDHLAAFLFTGDDVFKEISSLSGGEKGRLSLAKLMLTDANFLILDEPTNHLDILSREILEQALNRYTGTVLTVSHDRFFINRTAQIVWELDEKNFRTYLGNYDYYREKKAERETAAAAAAAGAPASSARTEAPAKSASQEAWRAGKQEQARLRKLKSDLAKAEEKVAQLEAALEEIDGQMAQEHIATDPAALQKLTKERAEVSAQLDAAVEAWEEAATALEEE